MKAQQPPTGFGPEQSSGTGIADRATSGNPLTLRQQEVFEFVARFKDERGAPPTLREVARHFGFRSTTAAADHLRALRRKGYLTFAPRQARSHQPLPSGPVPRPTLTEVPIYGSLPDPTQAHPNPQGTISVDTEQLGLRRGERIYAYRVHGESMVPRGILHGDIVLISRMRKPEPGAVVATLLGGASTLMTLVMDEGRPFLQTAGDPELIPAAEFLIQGVMVGLLRLCADRVGKRSPSEDWLPGETRSGMRAGQTTNVV